MPYNSVVDRTAAGPLMPEEAARDIWKGATAKSTVMTTFRRTRMQRAQQRQPVLAALPTAYFVTGDTGLKQTTSVNWTNKYINAEEIAVIVPIPDNVIADAEFDIWGEIRPLLEEAVGVLVDGAVLFGTDSSGGGVTPPAAWPTPVVQAAGSAGNSVVRGTSTVDVADDVNAVMGTMEADGYFANTAIAVPTLRASFRGLRDANKQPIFEQSIQNGTSQQTLWGVQLEYVLNGSFPTGALGAAGTNDHRADMLFLQREMFILAIRDDMNYKMLSEAVIQDNTGAIIYNLAQQDMQAMRLTMRLGWQVANPPNRVQSVEASRYPAAVLRPTGWV